jgi:pimeloyl-ACP methyl ester carboxylesterase
VLGHSLGAYVAPRLMAEDHRIAGCIIMAGPAAPLCWSALRQMRYLASLNNGAPAEAEEPPQIRDLQRQCRLSANPNPQPFHTALGTSFRNRSSVLALFREFHSD